MINKLCLQIILYPRKLKKFNRKLYNKLVMKVKLQMRKKKVWEVAFHRCLTALKRLSHFLGKVLVIETLFLYRYKAKSFNVNEKYQVFSFNFSKILTTVYSQNNSTWFLLNCSKKRQALCMRLWMSYFLLRLELSERKGFESCVTIEYIFTERQWIKKLQWFFSWWLLLCVRWPISS